MASKVVGIRVPVDLLAAVEAKVQEQGGSVKQIVLSALEEYVSGVNTTEVVNAGGSVNGSVVNAPEPVAETVERLVAMVPSVRPARSLTARRVCLVHGVQSPGATVCRVGGCKLA